MAKATPKKHNHRADPISKIPKQDKQTTEDKAPPKRSHLYTDETPDTTLHGAGFKDADAARRTIALVSKRSLTYQWQAINTMYNRARHHPSKTEDIQAAQTVLHTWLEDTYPRQRRERRAFRPLLSKKTVEAFLPLLRLEQVRGGGGGVDTTFAEMYVGLGPRRRLANTLVDEGRPGEADWDRAREDALAGLVPEGGGGGDDDEEKEEEEGLWGEDGRPSGSHLGLIAWAWSPVSEYKLLRLIRG